MNKQPHFYFRKGYRDPYDPYDNTQKIMLKKQMVGWIGTERNTGNCKVVIKINKPEKDNPNCKWSWMQLMKRFDSFEEAQKFITDNARDLADMIYKDEQ